MTFREIKRTRNHFTFVWAITNLMDMGLVDARKITDEQIEKAYQNEIKRQDELPKNQLCVYTPEVVRDMLITTRQLASIDFKEFVNGLVEFDLWQCHKISWDRMTELASAAIQNLDDDAAEYFIADCYLEEDEAEFLNEDLYNKFFNNEDEDEGDF